MTARWIDVPLYKPQATPPIDGTEASVRAAAVLSVEDFGKMPNARVVNGVEVIEYGARIVTAGGAVLSSLPRRTVVAMIEEAMRD
ncbi:hypothetical protein SEA_KOZIE_56 [Microbacterium phage Kozie]|uniref:Uncharacterized protein n=1 Tax=Microbacterium phage Kozie TaxID=2885981 RepID=A0AAE8Y8C4_9CAUD|nr:hypothetical protein QC998_gp56 [Microbacterium phage Kozie]UDL16252.1 hypothetical protein SEA_KOZIE_56 [Microbacterium phage Kozie]